MFRFGVLATFAAILLLIAASEGQAQGRNAGGSGSGYCPPGTCAQNGGPRAKELRHCSAANCRGTAPKSQKKK